MTEPDTEREEATGRRRLAGGAVVVGIGGLTGWVHLVHLLSSLDGSLQRIAYGTAVPLLFSAVLVVAGAWWYWVRSPDASPWVAAWTAVGTVLAGALALQVVLYQQAVGVVLQDQVFVVAMAASPGGAAGFLVGLYDDRTRRNERTLTEYRERIERERDRFRALFEHLPDPAFLFVMRDGEPIARAVNPAFEDAFGYDREAVVGESINDVIVPPDRETEARSLDSQLMEGDSVVREVRRRTASGVRDFLLQAVPLDVEDDERTGFVIAVDISEQKRRERRMEVLNRVLRHDLRTDANLIYGYADLIRRDDPDDEVREYADEICDAASDMATVGEKSREIERALRRASLSSEPVDVTTVVEDSAATFADRHPEAEIHTDGAREVRAYANSLLDTAVDNLIENAIEHNDRDPVVRVSVNDDGDDVVVRVEDNGPGIPDHEQSVIDHGRETDLRHSSGLGLWLTRWIVADLDGEMTLETGDDRGTTVRIRLPRAPDAQAAPDPVAGDP